MYITKSEVYLKDGEEEERREQFDDCQWNEEVEKEKGSFFLRNGISARNDLGAMRNGLEIMRNGLGAMRNGVGAVGARKTGWER